MVDITELSLSDKVKIAEYIKQDNLDEVNKKVKEVNVKNTFYSKYVKRILDIIIASICLLITLPINIVIAIITYFDVGRPILFKQQRIGKDEKKFIIYKFRNMTNEVVYVCHSINNKNVRGSELKILRKISALVLSLAAVISMSAVSNAFAKDISPSLSAGIVATSGGRLNVRSSPSTSGTRLIQLINHTEVILLEKSGGWWYI